ncbi:dnaJ homolog subfamily B member 12 [Ischnura elegans]|uniref:dnaJ homolog subfamily B member 12 n=1 Tax=Ischnura elegans TaxID=197161 RepID=UPI001ED8922E|nr:dnaJ homolog subfamily B member 12 [Ischnura elegans]
MMEGNKDEAERCIELAERSIFEGRPEKAERFLLKAEKLYPTQKAKDLLDNLSKNSSHQKCAEPEDAPRKRRTATRKEEARTSDTENDYPKEHVEAVTRILDKCKDFYEILEVDKEATDSEIKKAYKKKALQLHPDKNKTPRAAEAFKAIGNAVATLTDPIKRKQYDSYGSEEDRLPQQGRYSANQWHREGYSRGFEADISAEELFNMFFGGGFPSQNVYVRRGGRWQRTAENHNQARGEHAGNYSLLLQMLPILLLIAISMMSSLFISEPIYSLHTTSKFSVPKVTHNLKIPYYVKENFHTEYQGSLRRLEISVEEEYITTLRAACIREKSYRESMVWKARSYGDSVLYAKSQKIRMPSCETLQELHAKA